MANENALRVVNDGDTFPTMGPDEVEAARERNRQALALLDDRDALIKAHGGTRASGSGFNAQKMADDVFNAVKNFVARSTAKVRTQVAQHEVEVGSLFESVRRRADDLERR